MTQTIINLGTGGAALNGQNGSTAGADSNDALFLDWPGENQGNYVYLPGVASNFLSVPDEAALDITGDIDIRVQVAMDDWTPAAAQTLLAKGNWSTTAAYRLEVTTAGTLILYWSNNGSTNLTATSTVATGIADRSTKWVRATLDVDNGASGRTIQFFTSDDGATWTQLGTTITQATVTSIFSSADQLEIGSLNSGALQIAGKVYRAQVLNGINGTTVLDVDTSRVTSGSATSFTAVTGQTVTINRSTAGRKTVAVVSPVWLFGTDDFIQVANNALLNFTAAESFTAILVMRVYATPVNFGFYLGKWTGTGYLMSNSGTTSNVFAEVRDGVNSADTNSAGRLAPITLGSQSVVGFVVDRSAQTLRSFSGGVLRDSASTSLVGNITNATTFNLAVSNNAEVTAAAVFRRPLTQSEIAAITTYYELRSP